MKGYSKSFYLFLILSSVLIVECKIPKQIIKNDPERPFKYGQPFTLEECTTDIKYFAQDIGFKPGDVVADVGAGNGYLEGAFSVVTDSIEFYIEDINRKFLNTSEFNKVINYFTKLRGKTFTNIFFTIVGTPKKTNLPNGIFDKILLVNSFHEFTFPDLMIKDLKRKLKPGGKLFVCDAYSALRRTRFVTGCNLKAYKVSEVVRIMEKQGFYLDEMKYPENSYRNTLVFVNDEKSAQNLCRENNPSDNIVELLDKKSVAEDTLKTHSIADSLLTEVNKNIITNSYIGSWIYGIGYYWLGRKEYISALNVFNINQKLFPKLSYVYYSLGDVFMALKQYELAATNFKKSIELNPYDEDAKKKLLSLPSPTALQK